MRYLFAAVALLTAACGDGTGPDVIPEELAGEWVAYPGCLPNCGFTVTPIDNPGDSLNLVQSYGITMELTLARSGGIEIVARGGAPVDPIRGRVTLAGSMMILRNSEGAVDTVDYTVTTGRLAVGFRRLITLNGEPSRVTGVFHRP